MKKVYWDEKRQQITTKKGMCLFDPHNYYIKCEVNQRITSMLKRIMSIEQRMTCTKDDTLLHQLQCAAKGHGKWVFTKKDLCFHRNSPSIMGFYFECSECGLEITKTEKELTPTEKEGLKKLKLI